MYASGGSTEDTVPIQEWVKCAKRHVVDAKVSFSFLCYNCLFHFVKQSLPISNKYNM